MFNQFYILARKNWQLPGQLTLTKHRCPLIPTVLNYRLKKPCLKLKPADIEKK